MVPILRLILLYIKKLKVLTFKNNNYGLCVKNIYGCFDYWNDTFDLFNI